MEECPESQITVPGLIDWLSKTEDQEIEALSYHEAIHLVFNMLEESKIDVLLVNLKPSITIEEIEKSLGWIIECSSDNDFLDKQEDGSPSLNLLVDM